VGFETLMAMHLKIENYIMKTPCSIFFAIATCFLFLCSSILAEIPSEAQELQGTYRLTPDRILTPREQSKIEDLIARIETNSGDSDAAIESKMRAISRLKEMRHKQALPILKKIAEDEEEMAEIRAMAIMATLYSPDSSLIELFINQLTDNAPMVRGASRHGLIDLTGKDMETDFSPTPSTDEEQLRPFQEMQKKWSAWWTENQDTFEISSEGRLFRHPPLLDPERALTIQEQTQLKGLITQIETTFADKSQEARISKGRALTGLRRLHHTKTLSILEKVAKNEEEATENRIRAILAIQLIPDQSVLEILIDLLTSRDKGVSSSALSGLENLTEQKIGPSVYVSSPEEMERRYLELQNNWRAWWHENKDTFYMPLEPGIILK